MSGCRIEDGVKSESLTRDVCLMLSGAPGQENPFRASNSRCVKSKT